MAGEGRGLVSGLVAVHFKGVIGNAQSHNAAPPPPQSPLPPQSHPTCSVALLDLSLAAPAIQFYLQWQPSPSCCKSTVLPLPHRPPPASQLRCIQHQLMFHFCRVFSIHPTNISLSPSILYFLYLQWSWTAQHRPNILLPEASLPLLQCSVFCVLSHCCRIRCCALSHLSWNSRVR